MNSIDIVPGSMTEKLLTSISRRLSGRDDCKDEVYMVKIDYRGVVMKPVITVYPNRYHRHEHDKLDIVSWVHQEVLPNINLSQLVFGTYKYEKLGNSKKRSWHKV